jgi:hypothetical protein
LGGFAGWERPFKRQVVPMGEDEDPNRIVVVKGQWTKVDSAPGFL